MQAKAIARSSHLTRVAGAPATGRFLVYHVCLDGQILGVVPSWRLFEFLRERKVLNIHAKIGGLRDGDWFEFSTVVDGRPLNLAFKIAAWAIISN